MSCLQDFDHSFATLDDWDECQLCHHSGEVVEAGPLDEFGVPWTEETYECPRCGGYGSLAAIPVEPVPSCPTNSEKTI